MTFGSILLVGIALGVESMVKPRAMWQEMQCATGHNGRYARFFA